MKPMGYISTQFISYRDIKVDDIDIYEDAWGLYSQYHDVIEILDRLRPVVSRRVTKKLIAAVREKK
jgi:hypothetical protein